MNSLGGRLTRTFATTIAIMLIIIGFAIALTAYGIAARAVGDAAADSLRVIGDILPLYPTPQYEPRAKVDVIMTHINHPGLVLVVSEGRVRYKARWRLANPESTAGYIVSAEPRTGVPRSFGENSPLDRAALSLATLAGYEGAWAQFGDTEIGIIADSRSLTAILTRTLWAALGVALLAIAIAYGIGRALSREALRPLGAVVDALEGFAAGDLSPRPIVPQRQDELGKLAVAYNSAIQTVSSAFAERERTQIEMRQFMADAGHQLRTPLTVLRGFIDILHKGALRKPEDLTPIVEMMAEQSAIMTSLVDKLMLLEQWENARSLVADTIDVADAVKHIVAPIADAHPGRPVLVHAWHGFHAAIDHEELSYAVTNLMTNALKYAPDGAITIDVGGDTDVVTIAVSDEGPGLNDEELAHAFDRFYRGPRRDVPGSGLGLAIAKRAVERAKGTLGVESSARGARFTIALPRAAPVSTPVDV